MGQAGCQVYNFSHGEGQDVKHGNPGLTNRNGGTQYAYT